MDLQEVDSTPASTIKEASVVVIKKNLSEVCSLPDSGKEIREFEETKCLPSVQLCLFD